MERRNQKQINVKLDRKALNVVMRTFSFMIENYNISGVIDHAAWIIEKKELKDSLAKLMPYVESGQNPVVIPMGNDDWNIFTRLVDYSGYAAPKQEDRALLEKLYEVYSDWENAGMENKDRINVELDIDDKINTPDGSV